MMLEDDKNRIAEMVRLLEEIDSCAGKDFSGVGVIVSALPEALPIIALRPTSKPIGGGATASVLAEIAHHQHEHHDGFHVLTPELKIERISQYFSPPIVPALHIDRQKRFGGRYLAALFGSTLPSVVATGIVSRDFGLAVFQRGEEKFYRSAIDYVSTSQKASR